jgi:hypothetical protein
MHTKQWTLHVEPQAPPKPAMGAPCNGCGICCLVAPCPVGMVVSRRRHGACDALQWEPEVGAYRCGLMSGSAQRMQRLLPARAHSLAPWLARVLQGLAPRWIAAGTGCDSSLQADALTITPAGPSEQAGSVQPPPGKPP